MTYKIYNSIIIIFYSILFLEVETQYGAKKKKVY